VRNSLLITFALVWLTWGGLLATRPQASAPQIRLQPDTTGSGGNSGAYQTTINQYCVTCHNQRLKTGGLTLDNLDLSDVAGSAETWEKVVRKLRAGAMPPQGVRRPDDAAYHSLTSWLETELDRAAATHQNPGRPMLHRLNRAEYANAIRDVLALDVDVSSLLPPDDSAYGFDNISDVLGVSPSLQERYLTAALKISRLAVGDSDVTAGSDTYRVRQDLSQNQHIDGLPMARVVTIRAAEMY